MRILRPLAACVLGAAALAAAGCGSDKKSSDTTASTTPTTTTRGYAAKALSDVAPRTSKANVVGGDAPIEEFVQKAGNDAVSYFGDVFQKSQIDYAQPTIAVASQPTDTCAGSFDPTAKAFQLCADAKGSKITYGGPKLDELRTSTGDGAAAFLAGFVVAADANDQLTGNKIAGGAQPDAAFLSTSACFTGAWIRNLADRQILEQGDDQEVLAAAVAALGSGDVAQSAVKQGFSNGIGSCQQQSGTGGSDSQDQPAPSPTG